MALVITKFNPGLINDVQSLRILILTLLSDLNSLTLTCDEVCMTVCEQLKLHILRIWLSSCRTGRRLERVVDRARQEDYVVIASSCHCCQLM